MPEPREAYSTKQKWLITFTVMNGAVMGSLDANIVNVALPYMRGALGASVEEIVWVSTGYILSSVIMMPLVATLSARFGRRRFYIFSVVLFTVASTLCGFAQDMATMVTLRVIQGIGGGALIPLAQAILREIFPPEGQAMASGIYGLGVMFGPAIGPTLGGWLTDNYSWPWIFFIKWPLGVVATLLILRYIKDPPFLVREKGRLDFPGIAFLAVGLGALQVMLEEGQRKDWFASEFIVSLAAISCLGLILFVWRELKTEKPAVDIRILKDFNFASACLVNAVIGMALMGSLFLLPLFLQQLLHYPALDAGLALIPRSMGMILMMPVAGIVYNRVGPRLLNGAGILMLILSYYQLSNLSLDIGYWDIFFPQFIQGVGFGIAFVSLSTAAMATFEKRLLVAASGLYNVIRQVAGSIGIALAATLLTRGESWNRAMLVENIHVFSDGTIDRLQAYSSLFFSRGAGEVDAAQSALRALDERVMQQASMLSYNQCFFAAAALFVFTLPLIFLVKGFVRSVGPTTEE
jgi:DHA2 family multidrug resistance protein